MSPKGSKRPNAGRPRLGAGRTRQQLLSWAEEDYAEVSRAAERDGVPTAEYVRRAALELARGGGLLLPAEAAEVLREEAARRGVDLTIYATVRLAAGLPRVIARVDDWCSDSVLEFPPAGRSHLPWPGDDVCRWCGANLDTAKEQP